MCLGCMVATMPAEEATYTQILHHALPDDDATCRPGRGAPPRGGGRGGRAAADLVLRGGRVIEVHTGRILPLDVAIAGAVSPRSATSAVHGRRDGHPRLPRPLRRARLRRASPPRRRVAARDRGSRRGAPRARHRRARDVLLPAGCIGGADAVEELLARADETGLDGPALAFSRRRARPRAVRQPGGASGSPTCDGSSNTRRASSCASGAGMSQAFRFPSSRRSGRDAVERGVTIGGHLEGLTGPPLQASVALGARSDHETATAEEAFEKARLGLVVQIREGSGARDLDALVPAITEHGADPRCFAFCTDEQELRRRSPATATSTTSCASRSLAAWHRSTRSGWQRSTAARVSASMRDYGAVAPGRVASLAVSTTSVTSVPAWVIARGRAVGTVLRLGSGRRPTARSGSDDRPVWPVPRSTTSHWTPRQPRDAAGDRADARARSSPRS